MITDAQYAEWLDSQSRERVMLVEAEWSSLVDPIGENVNVALSSNGATAIGSTEDPAHPASNVINGERAGTAGAYWQDDTTAMFSDWVRVDFADLYLINRVVVYSVQDTIASPSEPTPGETGTAYVLRHFEVQAWTGTDWTTIEDVWNYEIRREVTFAPYRTTAIRILVHDTGDGESRVTEIEAFTPTATTGVERLSTHRFVTQPTDTPANTPYAAIVQRIPEFAQDMSDMMTGRTSPNKGTVEVISSTDTDPWLFERNWIGHRLRLYIGDKDWARDDFRAAWSGVIGNVAIKDKAFVLETRDLQHLLNQPLRVDVVESGPLLGQPMPLVIGEFYNVPAILIDDTTHTYAVNGGPVSSITKVKDRGVSVGFTASPTDGTFVVGGFPQGRVTADGVGSLGGDGNPIRTAADMIMYIATSLSYLTVDDLDIDSFVALNATCPQWLGLWNNSVGMQAYDAIDQITATVGAFTAVTREGKLFVKRFDFDGEIVASIGVDDIIEGGLGAPTVIPPVRDVRMAAKRNGSPNTYMVGGGGSGVTEVETNERHNSHAHFVRATNNAIPEAMPKGRRLRVGSSGPPPTVSGVAADDAVATLFMNPADAQAEANRRIRLWGFQRYLFDVTCRFKALGLRIGDAVMLTHPRYGLAAGRKGVVVKIVERYGFKTVKLGIIV